MIEVILRGIALGTAYSVGWNTLGIVPTIGTPEADYF